MDILVIVDKMSEDRFLLKAIKDVDVEITVVSKYEFENSINMGREVYIEAMRWGMVVYQ